jgi:hypothetical protein
MIAAGVSNARRLERPGRVVGDPYKEIPEHPVRRARGWFADTIGEVTASIAERDQS